MILREMENPWGKEEGGMVKLVFLKCVLCFQKRVGVCDHHQGSCGGHKAY